MTNNILICTYIFYLFYTSTTAILNLYYFLGNTHAHAHARIGTNSTLCR